jgi:Putative Ig domain
MGISKLNPSEGGIPYGNTAGRPANPGIGKLYSNGELQRIELYTGASYGWQNIVAETPGVTGYSGTVLETNLTNTITITGTNFSSGATATLVGTDGTEYNATSTTVNNLTSITATFNVISASKEPYDIKVTNPSNLYGVYYDVLTVNDKPAWTTAAGSLGLFNEGSSISVTVAATDEENNTITYSLAAGSSLPSGITLNSSTGVISGTLPDIASDTTYTFTINASDGLNTSQSRVFSITSTSLVDVDYLVIAGGGGGGSYGADVNGSNGAYQNGSSGSNSSISGSGITTITSIGGGYGGCYNGNEGGSGGSGGGAGGRGSTGTSAGGSGTSGQGFAGGNGIHDADKYPGGGGGGAGSAGASGTSSSYGNGGNGLASSITGSSVTRAGGGGGGGVAISLSTGLGGSGGGGNGGKSNVVHNSNAGAGGDGSINTGSGGGAGDYGYGAGHGGGGAGGYRTSYGTGNISGGNSPVENKLSLIKGTQYTITVGSGGNGGNYNKTYGRAGNGGSGIVILRSNIQASSTSGSPTYTNPSSGVYVYQFLNNGTITF